MKKLLLGVICVVGLMVGTAQAQREPVYETVTPRSKTSRMTSLANMVSPERATGCSAFSLSGKILKVRYAEDEMTIVGFVILRDYPKGEGNNREYINIESDLKERLGRFPLSILDTLITEGRRVHVWGFNCGTSGAIAFADKIKAFQ
jgi:hypothetical protein